MQGKQIKHFDLFSSLTTDSCRIKFLFTDESTQVLDTPPDRYAAAVATLQASSISYFSDDPSHQIHFISSAPISLGKGFPGAEPGH
jgi:hypothetical protein